MTVKEAVEKFLIAIRADGVKKSTVKWYCVRFRRFLDLYGSKDVRSVTLDDVREYIVLVQDEEISSHYFFALVRAVRRLFKWLYEERKIDQRFFRRIKLPKLPSPMPKAVTMDDVVKLVSVCGNSPAGYRNKSIILFLLDTGCRVGGMCSLKVNDLSFKKMRASIYEKGEKARYVLFGEKTSEAIKSWFSVRPFPENSFVFTSLVDDRPMNPNSVIQMLRRLKKKAKVKGRVNPHAFRHAFAREYILNGGDLASVSEIMGHSQLAVTKQFYAVFGIEELREKHNAFSPVSHLEFSNGRG
jgi:site-specific recombinase XerD